MLIQILLIIAIVFIGVFATRSAARDSHLALRRLFVFGAMIIAISVILVPEWLSAVARIVGIGRGADLLLYGLVLAFIGYVVSERKRNVTRSREITNLGRALSLAQARAEDSAQRPPAS